MISKLFVIFLLAYTMLFYSCAGKTYSQGQRLYQAHCSNCHMDDGTGLAKLIPPLVNSDYLKNNQALIPCILRNGQSGEIVVNGVSYNQEMPGQKYTEVQINNMINYINSAWGNNYPSVTIKETKERLQNCTK